MEATTHELNVDAMPRLVQLEQPQEEGDEPKKDYRAPAIVKRVEVDRETMLRLIKGVRSL
ncbi:MAG: hypothetical protein HY023_12165 [Chloroflexi bacterium]|nr:hypothetical protein [Chloroflexota bacterium]MBI3764583.1 hypothetical protein [Chloroflexota bacterium]